MYLGSATSLLILLESIDKHKTLRNKSGFFCLQGPSIWAECWKEFKFAVDIRAGDTKPVEKEEESDSSSSSGSDDKSENHYGVISEPESPHSGKKSKSDYAVYNEANGKKH